MDFSVINDFPSQSSPGSKQITVIHAENGSLYEYPYIKFVSPIGLKRGNYLAEFVEKEYGVSKGNQFILRSDDGKLLDNNVTLEDFFRKDTTIYVFVLKGEANQNIQDDFEVIGGMMLEKKWSESILQILPTHYENLLGKDVKDLIEPQSVDTYNDLMALFCDIKTELNSIKDGTIKLKRQKNAEEVAKKNLFNYFSEKKRKFDEILGGRESQIEVFQGYLNNFDKYIEKLSTKEIDPQLGEEEKKYLIDYFDVEKLRKSKATYEKNQIKIKQKSTEIKENIVEYDNHLKKLEDSVKDNSGEIHALLGDQENSFADIQSINLQGFKQLVEDKKGAPTQKDLSDFSIIENNFNRIINVFLVVKRENETSAPKLREIHQELRVIKEKLEDQLKENAGKLKRLVSDIMNLRVIIKSKIYNKLKVFCSIVDKHAEQIFNLEIIESFPKVYEQSLGEIRRRTGFKKDYLTVLNILESFAQSENKQRQEFLEMYQQFLPKSFCPFLSKTFPQLNFDHIRRMIDQDLNTEMNDFIQYSNRGSNDEAAETLRLIKNLTNNVDTKEKRMNELADSLQKMHEENETLKGQLKHRLLNVDNIRKLLGETNFEEKVQEYAVSLRDAFIGKVSQLEKRVADLQNDKLAAVNKKIAEYKSNFSVSNSATNEKLESYEARTKEMEEKINVLNESLAVAKKSKEEVSAQLEQASAKLEKVAAQLQENAATNETLKKELEHAEKSKAMYEAEKIELLNQVSLIGEQLEEAKKNENSNKESDEKNRVELTKKLQATEAKIEVLKAEIEALQIHLEETTQRNEMKKAEVEELQHHLSEKTAQFLQKEEELNDVKTASDGFKKDYETLLENFDQMRTMVENAKNGLQKSSDEELKKKDIEIMKKEEEILKKEEEIKKKVEEIKNKVEEIAEKNKEIAEKDQEISKRDERIAMKNEEVKLLKEKINKNEAKLEVKEDELNQTMKNLEMNETELNELRDILQQSMDVSMAKPANNLLGELGNGILTIYAKLNGENDPKIAGTLDIQDALSEIAEIIENKMVKIEDLQPKDKAIAIRLPTKKEYLVLNNLLDFILNIYTPPENEDLGDIIIGEIESISGERDAGPLKNIYKQDVTTTVVTVLKNTRSLSSIRFSG